MYKFTPDAFTKKDIQAIFFPLSPRKCRTCKKIQTRKYLLPNLFPDALQKSICMCAQDKKKNSKEKKQKVPPKHENSNEKDIPNLNNSQNMNDQVHLSQNDDNNDGMSQNMNEQVHLSQNDVNNDGMSQNMNDQVHLSQNDFVTRREFNLCINRLETDILGLKNDVLGIKNGMLKMESGINDLTSNVNNIFTILSNNNLKK